MKNWKTKIALILTAGLLSAAGAVTALAASRTRLDTVSDVYWGDDGTTANWDAVDDAYQYEIRLFCNDSQMDTVKTKKDYYDMEKKMTKEGDYTFKVRALAKSGSKEFSDGYWSEESETTYISESFAEMIKNGGSTSGLKNGGPGAGNGSAAETEKELVRDQLKWTGKKARAVVVPEFRWQLSEGRLVAGSRQAESGISLMSRATCRLAGSTGTKSATTARRVVPWR